MGDINYVSSIVKILENPIQKVLNDKTLVTEFRVQLPQIRNTRIVNLIIWGNLGRDIINDCQVNDYVMIEGYLSACSKTNIIKSNYNKPQITVVRLSFLNKNIIYT